MIKKFALLTIVISQATHAGPISHWQLTRLAADPTNESLRVSIRDDVKANPKAWFHQWSNDAAQYQYGHAWENIGVDLLRWTLPDRTFDWSTPMVLGGISNQIFTQDSLVDLERAHAYQLTYGETRGTMHPELMTDTHSPQYQLIATSQRRLTMGLAPIGPDNNPVVVCKLGLTAMSPYIEMSQTQRQHIAQLTGLNLDFCLNGEPEAEYWKTRFHDFVRPSQIQSERHNPGTSW